ncbi:putative GTP-binding protein rho1 [Blattamonas nauphoetae]|uniref:GTP-binding protein rho1 n=1 Tax=Blattamonas nauphoetae TaxID=2049346 RepID=A0ABQ9XHQ6_9EUKA|nr:putative GTP-binding protein rho1 [Blattamonas nauphoetae]
MASSGVLDVKCVVIGDGAVGKTCLLMSYTQNTFPENYVATVFDNYESLQVVDGKTVHLQLWDTAGQDEYDRLRSLSFPDTEVFLVCFSISDPASLTNVEKKWYEDIKTYMDNTPVILVGTKSDFRENPPAGVELVTKEQAEAVVKKLKLTAYVECSARTQHNLSAVFEKAARSVLEKESNGAKPQSGGGGGKGCSCTVL